ncbi:MULTISPECIES: hypothetical protein [unclassified Mycolicibacterium]|uniref:hypothetical protein n=1 Tax=unclassified Mycolicibacterium TaxID=2636767 RepID=UPI002ED937D8
MTDETGLDLREITKADIYIGEALAAHLTRARGDAVNFDYVAKKVMKAGYEIDRFPGHYCGPASTRSSPQQAPFHPFLPDSCQRVFGSASSRHRRRHRRTII